MLQLEKETETKATDTVKIWKNKIKLLKAIQGQFEANVIQIIWL